MALYVAIWVVFLEFLLAMTPLGPPYRGYAHAMLGVGIVGLAYYDFDQLRRTTSPGRLKRIAAATWYLSLLTAGLLFFDVGSRWTVTAGVTSESSSSSSTS